MRQPYPLMFGAAAVALACLAAPATAQNRSASDVTMGNVTSSAIAGGTVAVAVTPAVAVAVAAAGASVIGQLASGTLTATTPAGDTVTIRPATQAMIMDVLTGGSPPLELVAGLAATGARAEAGDLAKALKGLISRPATGQLAEAVGHYNALVLAANPGFLANPTPQFLAVHSVLSQLIAAAHGAH